MVIVRLVSGSGASGVDDLLEVEDHLGGLGFF